MPGIYFHIPYCRKACIYCDFHFSTSLNTKPILINAINAEHDLRAFYLNKSTVSTIYFGGGTPSVLTEKELSSLLNKVYQLHEVSPEAELTFECNPDDLNSTYLKMLLSLGINRLSIGLQTFVEEELSWMNRSHQAQQNTAAVKLAQDTGFSNISIDLIYGSRYQTEQVWEKNLQRAIELNVQHLSAYNLTVEDKTMLGHLVKKKQEQVIDDENSARFFRMLTEICASNQFIQYEISNFGKQGFFSQHNSSYWKGDHYLGLGPAAHSYNGKSRQWNIANNHLYIKSITEHTTFSETETLTNTQKANEYILTGLRTIWGIEEQKIRPLLSEPQYQQFIQKVSKYINKGQLNLKEGALVLSTAGKLMADGIASDLFAE